MDRQIKKKFWTLRRTLGIGLAIVFVLSVGYVIIFGDHSSKLNVRAERLTVSTVVDGKFQEFIAVTGSVIPIRTNYLDAMEGGRVDTVYLEAGSFVNQGDSLLKLANTNLLLDIMYREAELVQQSNSLRNTRLTMAQQRLTTKGQLLDLDNRIKQQKRLYDRQTELLKKGLVAQQEYDEAKDEYEYLMAQRDLALETQHQDSIYREVQIEQLEASLARMEDNLSIVKKNLENLVIRAPVSGHLTSLNAVVGESKVRGERLGQIDVLDGFKIRVPVDEHYISRINVGQLGQYTLDDQVYRLTVNKVYPEVLNGRFEIDMVFDGAEPESIRRGQTARLRLELGDLSDAILLERGAFYQKTGGRWVFVLDSDGEVAEKRFIRLGNQNPQYYEVLDGLHPGERVITSSYDNFGDVDKLVLN